MRKQNPFSIYDFLGYLVPGSIVLYSLLIHKYLKTNEFFKIDEFINKMSSVKLDSLLLFIILSYIIGHLINFISSVTIEKYANWRYGYPSKYLLSIEIRGFWKSIDHWKEGIWRIGMIIILLPIISLDLLFGKYLNFKQFYQKELDPLLRDLIVFKINKLFNKIGFDKVDNYKEFKNGKANGYDFHRIVTHYAYENSKNHQSKMSNYVALYGFLRSLSLIFNFISIYYFLRTLVYSSFNIKSILTLFILGLISYTSFMAFMKFYRRYSLEGFMVIAIDPELK
ncbi:MAG: hypothetical protein ABFS12_16890 [Bacteroidota bacterium]